MRDSISGQFTDDAPGSKQGAEAPKEPAAQPASQQASATAQQQPPSAQRSSPSEAAYPQAASPQPQQQQQQQQGEGTTGRPFMGQESQSGRQQAGAESSTGREQAGPGKQAGPGEGASREEQPGQAGTKQPRESMLSRVQRAARAVRSEVCSPKGLGAYLSCIQGWLAPPAAAACTRTLAASALSTLPSLFALYQQAVCISLLGKASKPWPNRHNCMHASGLQVALICIVAHAANASSMLNSVSSPSSHLGCRWQQP